MSYYQFVILLNSKTHFHRLESTIIHFPKQMQHIFGIKRYTGEISRKTRFGQLLYIDYRAPNVTFYDQSIITEVFHSYKTLDIDELTLEYARLLVHKEESADSLFPFVKNGYTIFPFIPRKDQNDFIICCYQSYLHIVFNNERICDYYINSLVEKRKQRKGIDTNEYRFLYFSCFYTDSCTIVTKKLLENKIDVLYKNTILKMR